MPEASTISLPPEDDFDQGNIADALDDYVARKPQEAPRKAGGPSTLRAPSRPSGAAQKDPIDETDIAAVFAADAGADAECDGDLGLMPSTPPQPTPSQPATSDPASASASRRASPHSVHTEPDSRKPLSPSNEAAKFKRPAEGAAPGQPLDPPVPETTPATPTTPGTAGPQQPSASQGPDAPIHSHSDTPASAPITSKKAPASAETHRRTARAAETLAASSATPATGESQEKAVSAPSPSSVSTEVTDSAVHEKHASFTPVNRPSEGAVTTSPPAAANTATPNSPVAPRDSNDKPQLPQGRAVVLPPVSSQSQSSKQKVSQPNHANASQPESTSRERDNSTNETKPDPRVIDERDLLRVKARWSRGWGNSACSNTPDPEMDVTANDDDDDGWQEMPVMRTIKEETDPYNVLDEEDRKRLHFRVPSPDRVAHMAKSLPSPLPYKKGQEKSKHARTGSEQRRSLGAGNATGQTLDVHDARGYEWRARPDSEPEDEENVDSEEDAQLETFGPGRGYTQVHLDEDEEAEQLYAATEYLFSHVDHSPYSDKPVDAVSQMDTAKGFLSEAQRIAYVGLCALLARQVGESPLLVPPLSPGSKKPQPSEVGQPNPELTAAQDSGNAWMADLLAKLYLHMDIAKPEQSMIASLDKHGVLPSDLAPTLITTQVIENPDFDPEALAEREREETNDREVEALNHVVDAARSFSLQPDRSDANGIEENDASTLAPAPDDDSSAPEEKLPDKGKKKDLPTESEKDGAELKENLEEEKEDESSVQKEGESREQEPSKKPAPEAKPALLDPNSAAQGTIGELRGHTEWAVRRTHKDMAPLPMHGTGVPDAPGEPAARTTRGQDPASEALPPEVPSAKGAGGAVPSALEGVSTEVTAADKTITLDLRWTVLCDLFLLVTFDADYDSRSRCLLEEAAVALGLSALDVTKFETRIAETLEIDDGAARHLRLRDRHAIQKRAAAAKRRRMLMLGLATIGGGLVLGLSAGILTPFIGAGLGAAFTTIGISGTSAFFGGAGGAAVITTTATLAGSSMAGRSMNRRTRAVRVFEFKPIHQNNRFRCILGIPGFMNGDQDDPRLPFSPVDSMMGDLYSVLWEPDLMREMGAAMGILWNETVAAGIQQVLAVTVAGSLIGALAWPLWLAKLSYLIDNPWSNSLDRARAAGLILADVILRRQMGSRPLTLVAFSLGARVIFYALRELYRVNGFGLVQDVYLVGAPVTASNKVWRQVRSVVAGRFVNGYSKTDWILGYLHRATSGGLASVAGLNPILGAPNVDNVDLTHIVPGHLAYRALMPLVLGELGFRTTADYFDEPEDLSKVPEREVRPMTEEELRGAMNHLQRNGTGKADDPEIAAAITAAQKAAPPGPSPQPTPPAPPPPPPKTKSFASFFKRKKSSMNTAASANTSIMNGSSKRPESSGSPAISSAPAGTPDYDYDYDEDVDVSREDDAPLDEDNFKSSSPAGSLEKTRPPSLASTTTAGSHFDPDAILAELRGVGIQVKELPSSMPSLHLSPPPQRSLSLPTGPPRSPTFPPPPAASPLRTSSVGNDLDPSSPTARIPYGLGPTESSVSSVWGGEAGVPDLPAPTSAYGSTTRPSARSTAVRRESNSVHPSSVWGTPGASSPGLSGAFGSLGVGGSRSGLGGPSGLGGLGPTPSSTQVDTMTPQPGVAATVSSPLTPPPLGGKGNVPEFRPLGPTLTFGGADGEIALPDEEENPWG